MKYFTEMNSQQFGAASRYYRDKAGLEHAKYWEYVANAFQRYTDTGRVDYLNNMVSASLNAGRYRAFSRVTKALCAHEWDEATRQFIGKADKAKLKRLRKLNPDTGAASWEQTLHDHLEKEMTFGQTKPKKGWDEDTCILNFVKQLTSHDVNVDKDVFQRIEDAAKKLAAEKASKAA